MLEKNQRHFPPIKWVGFDVDGVMTDGGLYIDDNAIETKRFHSRDGHGLKMLLRSGINCAVITGRKSKVVENRFRELGFKPDNIYQGVFDKGQLFKLLLEQQGLSPENAAFAGDDVVDLPILLNCALPMAPSDACPEALKAAYFISRSGGGRGAVREMVEFILKGLGLWHELIERYKP
ncbi:MAG: phenylphosphate carboxylase subunit delta [Deltaproteobacteria bacterium]|jgi:3-deoxy-D-manno-octulosonate 8-phosphate phosphatase (KDO 8-P phosphatase)|nr:phenylphosphate carboxylase subunit delta [Deltaproteobacteria bacterium]